MNKWDNFTTHERLVILAALAGYDRDRGDDPDDMGAWTARGLMRALVDAIYDSETA